MNFAILYLTTSYNIIKGRLLYCDIFSEAQNRFNVDTVNPIYLANLAFLT